MMPASVVISCMGSSSLSNVVARMPRARAWIAAAPLPEKIRQPSRAASQTAGERSCDGRGRLAH
eukprot:1233145-Pyramimonas_sp.AAC.1